ncbi:MAG: ArgE/DapE family deacylase [Candidatus Omnitrophota bacterium]
MTENMFNFLESNKNSAVSFLASLVKIPTINPPGKNYEKIVSVIEGRCKVLGLKAKRIVTPKNILCESGINNGSKRISLVCDWYVGAKKTFHICCHYDVVPASGNWTKDPFKPTRVGNKLFGRGTEDMKANIVVIMSAVEALKVSGIKPKINIQLSFTPDEETGGVTGLGYLVKKGLVKADYAMTEGYSDNYISMGNKGVLWGEVQVTGKPAHASLPYLGVNSFERAAELIKLFQDLKKKLSKKKTRFDIKDKRAKSGTIVIGGYVKGGEKVNIVPGLTRFSFDRRLIPEENIRLAKKEIEGVIKRFNSRFPDSKASVKFFTEGRPVLSKKDKRLFEVASNAVKKVTKKKAKFSIMPGATDIRYFMAKGVPSLGYSVRGGDSWHSEDEFIYIDSLVDTAKVYALIMSELK